MEVADLELEARLAEAMIRDQRVNVLEINTSVTSGVVTLRGDVGSEGKRIAAEQIARETEGVAAVINELTVGRVAEEERVRMIADRLIERLIEEWGSRTAGDPFDGVDYLMLSLMMISEVRPPRAAEQYRAVIDDAKRRAIGLVAGFCGMSPVMVALELRRLEGTLEEIGKR